LFRVIITSGSFAQTFSLKREDFGGVGFCEEEGADDGDQTAENGDDPA